MTLPIIHFVDLDAQRARISERIDAAIARVLAHGQYIMGPEVAQFEQAFAEFCGVAHVVSTSNGTDALVLPLMAWSIGPGDAVFVPAFTFAATAEAAALVGATPVLVDVNQDSFNMDPASLEAAIAHAESLGLAPRAVIPADLFGLPAGYGEIAAICQRHGLRLLADAAQSAGASRDGKRSGALAPVTATSFFPAKPLGCYGDGGAVMTDDGDMAEILRSLRFHGRGEEKYDNVRIGMNARLDTIQAAVLIEKLAILEDEIAARGRIAAMYGRLLGDAVETPKRGPSEVSAFAQYTIRSRNREAIRQTCAARRIPTMIYYPRALTQQTAYRAYPAAPGGAPVAEELAATVLSLPMHPYLEENQVAAVAAAIRESA